jgi:hypothetical protein
MSELSDAVDDLTNPRTDIIDQMDDAGRWLRAHEVVHAPLLEQLEEAITSCIGNGGGGGSSTGNLLNDEALYRCILVRQAIEAWCRIVHVEVTKDMVVDLRSWHNVYKQGETKDFYTRTVMGWVDMIGTLLDPPKRLEVTANCPVCGNSHYTDAEGASLPFPVVIEYPPSDASAAAGLCRACDFAWVGERALRNLRWELDAQEAG